MSSTTKQHSDRRRSAAWKHFTKRDAQSASCNLCGQAYLHRGSPSNLSRHLRAKHADALLLPSDESESDEETGPSPGKKSVAEVNILESKERDDSTGTWQAGRARSWIWRKFVRTGDHSATCRACSGHYLCRGGVSNLKRHWERKHADLLEASQHDDSNDEEYEFLPKGHTSKMRKYFRPSGRDGVAHCRVCDDTVPSTAEELAAHLEDRHDADEDDGSDQDQAGESTHSPKKEATSLWRYFKWDGMSPVASCRVCRRQVSRRHGTYYLKRHLKIRHPTIRFEPDDDANTIIISADGQLYEVENEQMDMDTVYLDEFEDLVKDTNPPAQNGRAKPLPTFKTKRKSRNEPTSDEDVTELSTETKGDSLDFFGKYLISLLKDLPKHISDQLQSQMVKQALDAKIAYQAQQDFKITVVNSNLDSNEPVTVTVTESDAVAVAQNAVLTLQDGGS